MRRNLLRNLLFLMAAIGLVTTSLVTMHVLARADQNARVALSGQQVPLIQHAQLLGAANASQTLNLSIGLQPRDPAGLDSLLSAMYTPGSSTYHHYLTPDDFKQLFAPTSDQVQQVISYLQSQGFTIGSISPNNLLIDATTTVAQAQQAFQVKINTYHSNNRSFYANAQSPTMPASLETLISSIGGLDNSTQEQPLDLSMPVAQRQAQQARTTPAGYGPVELSTAYDTTPLASANIQGDGQAVALFELDGYQPSDIQQYFQNYNLGTPNLTNVLVDGATGAAGQGAIEAELDIEVVGALAPHANQLIYEGPNTTQGLNDTYSRIVTDDQAHVLSTSWGLCESSTGSAELQTLDTIFKQAAAQGISIFAAAGDSGAYDCGDTNLAVDSPADDPAVTGVGGTNLQLGSNDSYGSETAWSDSTNTARGPKGIGGGGGISDTFVQPSWQTGNGVINSFSSGQPCNAPSGQVCREVPDVSADADPATGYAVFCTVTAAGCNSSGWTVVGGTSAAAPFWAGSTALINQYLQNQHVVPLGSANPTLYGVFHSPQAAPAYHDVTGGNNLFYPATSGYDMASGIGSPDVANLAQDLAADLASGNPTPTPTPTPAPPLPTPTPTPAPPVSLLIKNGGFENGSSPWQETSSGGYELVSSLNPHTGNDGAYLCGYTACNDRIWQTFTVPKTYTALSLAYWWNSDTLNFASQCLDTFTVVLQNAAGQSVSSLQHDCNNDPTNGWRQKSFSLTSLLAPYKGQKISLVFHGTTPANEFMTSNFYVDDVSLSVN
jgi:subtilase family serine protease